MVSPEFLTHILKYSFSSVIQIYHLYLKYNSFQKELILFHEQPDLSECSLCFEIIVNYALQPRPTTWSHLHLPYIASPWWPQSPNDSTSKTALKSTLPSTVSLPGIFVLLNHLAVAYLICSVQCFHNYAPEHFSKTFINSIIYFMLPFRINS